MNAYELSDGNYLVPTRAESLDGVIGDGMNVITPEHQDYKAWSKFVRPATLEMNKAYSTRTL
jgi:hypothetical protein